MNFSFRRISWWGFAVHYFTSMLDAWQFNVGTVNWTCMWMFKKDIW